MFCNFRGSFETIYKRNRKYASFFLKGPVLDLGCGRGEFLQILRENNIDCLGIDSDPDIINELKKNNYNAEFISFKEFYSDTKFYGIMACHIVEHIPADSIKDFIKKCYEHLEKNGVLLIITPNFQNIEVATETFWKDLEHTRPYPISLMRSLLEDAGFFIMASGLDKDTGHQGFKKVLAKMPYIGKYFLPKDAFIAAKK